MRQGIPFSGRLDGHREFINVVNYYIQQRRKIAGFLMPYCTSKRQTSYILGIILHMSEYAIHHYLVQTPINIF